MSLFIPQTLPLASLDWTRFIPLIACHPCHANRFVCHF